MDNKIYSTPKSELATPSKPNIGELCEIAKRQRIMIGAIGVQFGLNAVGKNLISENYQWVIFLLAIATLVFVVTSVIRLSLKINHPLVTVILGVISIIPLLNLVVLLILSRQSTNRLKKHGVQVGFMGASEDEIRKKVISI